MNDIGREASVCKKNNETCYFLKLVFTWDPGCLSSSTLVLRGCIISPLKPYLVKQGILGSSAHLFLSLPLTGRPWLNSISLCFVPASSSSNSLSSIRAFFSADEELEVLLAGASTTNSLLLLEAKGTSPCGGPNLPERSECVCRPYSDQDAVYLRLYCSPWVWCRRCSSAENS